MPSPTRRSTRSVPTHTSSSASSASSSRPERATRAHRSPTSPGPHPQMDKAIDALSENDEEEEAGNDTTRCICGSQDYPGPPSTDENKSLSEDSGSFFIQCDNCNVWQHGGCVGIMAEEHSPDNYACEQCEKRLHQLHTDQKGQRYSLYLPVTRRTAVIPRKTSITRDNDVKLKRDREMLARLGADLTGPKRRSTMNSRQNYDEEEMLRKAIEESRGDLDTGGRKIKRLRDESEDTKPHVKRQRTGSDSIEAASTRHTGSVDADSDDDTPQTKSAIKRARAAAAENQRQRDMREREKLRDQQREEAAGRRKERAGRRRADEEGDDPTVETTTATESMPPPSRPTSPPPPNIQVTQPSSSHKKTADKGKRPARNQYTKDSDGSPPRSKNGGSSSSGEDIGKRATANVKQTYSLASTEPTSALPPAAPAIKPKARSHKAKVAAPTSAGPEASASSKAESSGSETGKKKVPPPVSQMNQQVAAMEREILKWEDEVRERAARYPTGTHPNESLRHYERLRAMVNDYKKKHYLPDPADPTRLSAGAGVGLGVS